MDLQGKTNQVVHHAKPGGRLVGMRWQNPVEVGWAVPLQAAKGDWLTQLYLHWLRASQIRRKAHL